MTRGTRPCRACERTSRPSLAREHDAALGPEEGLVGGAGEDVGAFAQRILELAAADQPEHVRAVVEDARPDLLAHLAQLRDGLGEEEETAPQRRRAAAAPCAIRSRAFADVDRPAVGRHRPRQDAVGALAEAADPGVTDVPAARHGVGDRDGALRHEPGEHGLVRDRARDRTHVGERGAEDALHRPRCRSSRPRRRSAFPRSSGRRGAPRHSGAAGRSRARYRAAGESTFSLGDQVDRVAAPDVLACRGSPDAVGAWRTCRRGRSQHSCAECSGSPLAKARERSPARPPAGGPCHADEGEYHQARERSSPCTGAGPA